MERPPPAPFPQPRRVATAPDVSRPASTSPSSPSPSTSTSRDAVETLYSHPTVKITALTALTASRNSPATPPLERTIAVGPFRIYRAPGSVAFLSCGSALQPILPRSQCWSISEDNSRFVLQIRRPQYWRIELPVDHPDDVRRALLLRHVFDNTLLFEKTECPFERTFTVTLPDLPSHPIKKKAWTAEGKNLLSSPFEFDLSPPAQTPVVINRGAPVRSHRTGTPTIPTASNDTEQAPHVDELPPGESRQGSLLASVHNRAIEIASFRSPGQNSRGDAQSVQAMPLGALHLAKAPSGGSPLEKSLLEEQSLEEQVGCAALSHNTRDGTAHPPVAERKSNGATLTAQPRTPTYSPPIVESPFWVHNKGPMQQVALPPAAYHESTAHDAVTLELLKDEGASNANVPLSSATSNTEPGCPVEKHDNPGVSTTDDSEPGGQILSEGPAFFEGSGRVAPVNLARKRMTRMLAGRSFTAPPQLTVVTSSLCETEEKSASRTASPAEPSPGMRQSPTVSVDSFHSTQSWHSPITPPLSRPESPQISHRISVASDVPLPALGTLEWQTMPKTGMIMTGSAASSVGTTPTYHRYEDLLETPLAPKGHRSPVATGGLPLRQRSRPTDVSLSRRKTLSPLPPAASLFSPSSRRHSPGRLQIIRRLPAAIVHKTVEILLSPPSHLVNLMLKVAAMIAAGEWRGLVFGQDEMGEHIPVQWDYFSDGEFSSLSDDDDYHLSTNPDSGAHQGSLRKRFASGPSNDDHGSWGVD